MNTTTNQRTASQRIEDLERNLGLLFQQMQNMSRDVALLRDVSRLTNERLTALIQVTKVEEKAVDAQMRVNTIDNLKAKVKELVEKGTLVKSDTITENSFVVGNENEPAAADGTPGKVINERLQFAVFSVEKEIQDKLKDHKVGDIISFKDDALVFEVTEVYNIIRPQEEVDEAVPQTEAAPDSAKAPVAPVADAATTQQTADSATTH